MQFIKNFFNHDKTIIGLSGLRKRKEYLKITIPDNYKKTYIGNFEQNYLLFYILNGTIYKLGFIGELWFAVGEAISLPQICENQR